MTEEEEELMPTKIIGNVIDPKTIGKKRLELKTKDILPSVKDNMNKKKRKEKEEKTLGKQPAMVTPIKKVRKSGWKNLFGLKGGGPNPGNSSEEEKLLAVEKEGFLAGVNLEVSSDFLS